MNMIRLRDFITHLFRSFLTKLHFFRIRYRESEYHETSNFDHWVCQSNHFETSFKCGCPGCFQFWRWGCCSCQKNQSFRQFQTKIKIGCYQKIKSSSSTYCKQTKFDIKCIISRKTCNTTMALVILSEFGFPPVFKDLTTQTQRQK